MPEQIVRSPAEIVEDLRNYGVNDIYVSGVSFRHNYRKHISETNNLLKAKQLSCDFTYIDNDNITATHLWKDKIQLNNNGTTILVNNFIDNVNGENIA